MTDSELLEILKKDKNEGLGLLIDTYSALVYKIVSSVVLPVGTREDAEECVSDTFISFYKHIDDIDLTKGSIKGYLAVTGKRLGINMYYKLKAKNDNEHGFDEIPEMNVRYVGIKSEDKKFLLDSIEALGEPDCTIIKRRYLLGERANEIAEEIGMSPEAVQKRLERNIAKLRHSLGGVFDGQY